MFHRAHLNVSFVSKYCLIYNLTTHRGKSERHHKLQECGEKKYTYSSQAARRTFASVDRVWTWQRRHIALQKEQTLIMDCSLQLVLCTTQMYLFIFKFTPASFVVSISSYSSRILSSRSFSSLSQIIPTCLRENKGCSFLVGDEAPEDVPVGRITSQSIQDIQYTAIMPSRYGSVFMDDKCVLCSNAIIVLHPSDGHSLKDLKSTLLLHRVSLW